MKKSKAMTSAAIKMSRYEAMAFLLQKADGRISFTEDPKGGCTQYCIIKFTTPSAKAISDASELPRKISRILNAIRLDAKRIPTQE